KAYLLVQPDLSFETITVEDTNAEEARLDAALQASQDELSVIREKAVGTLGEEAAQVFDAHLMVLADPEMISQIKETIRAKIVINISVTSFRPASAFTFFARIVS
ncbi:phosphoenolpyruvate-utilizing N-terminal domain-containing protein, partial [Pseudomonas aeruginosa]